MLLIAGGRAEDESEAAAYLRAAAPDRVKTWTVPGASHTRALATAPAEWTARVTGFLDRALKPADSSGWRPGWASSAAKSGSQR